jgi:hypothetical protein
MMGFRKSWLGRYSLFALKVSLLAVLMGQLCSGKESTDAVVVQLGEPYEQVRRHSRSTLPPWEPGDFLAIVTRPATFHFDHARYGFTTPAAKFLAVGMSGRTGNVDSVTLSPQVEALPLDDALAILLDLQAQLRRGGWRPFQASYWRPIEDESELRRTVRECKSPMTVWNAGTDYQVNLDIRCFGTDAQPQRYLITLQFGRQSFKDYPYD